MNLKRHLYWFIWPIFLLSCARQSTPTGGPKDTIPPVLVASIPSKQQIKFKDNEVELTFNETVIVNNPKDQILIIPDVGKNYKIEAKKKKVILSFEQPLKDSTTYSINFRDAVQDITEKNPSRNLKLAFSTGNYIDSLSIEGKVLDLLQAKELKDATVALFEADTFNIFKHKPSYITKTNEKGLFIIENLKPGQYYIYSVQDKNKNLIVDSKTESYGYIAEPITLNENLKKVSINTIKLDSRPLKIISARPYNTYFNIRLAKGLAHYTLAALEREELISCFTEDRANIKVYNTVLNKDSIAVRFQASDSINNTIDTTLYVKFSTRQATPEKFDLKTENLRIIQNKGFLTGTIKFTKPLAHINFDSIKYQIDSARLIPVTPQDIQYDTTNNTLTITKSFDKTLLHKPETKAEPPSPQRQSPPPTRDISKEQKAVSKAPRIEHQFYLGTSAFISVESDSSKKTTLTLKPIKLEDTGIIIAEIQTDHPNFIVELLDKNFKVLQTKKNQKKVSFEDLEPTDYQLRVVIDRDNNGQWSPGNFFYKKEPEPIAFYKNENNQQIIKLRANFELGPLLIKF